MIMIFLLFGLSLLNTVACFWNVSNKKYALAGLSFFAAAFAFAIAIISITSPH